MKTEEMPANNLRCLRDPKCERHPYHAGHLSVLSPVDPRVIYQARRRNKIAGHRAWCLVKEMEENNLGTGLKLTDWQRRAMIANIKVELLNTHLMPIGE